MDVYAIVGYLTVSYITIRILLIIWHFLRLFVFPTYGFRLRLTTLGQWAIITGSTDGIGKAYAQELARRGLNVMLISRNNEKLKVVKEEIDKQRYGNGTCEVKTLAIDFSQPKTIYQTIATEIQDLDVGILVNNVGVAYDYPKYYHELDEQMCDRLLNINITSVLEMTRIVLPKMMKNNRGAIINVASISAVVPVALLSVYSASKAFVDFFSRNLSVECNNNSIIVQSLTPVLVLSNMIRINKPTLFIPSPTKFAKQAVNTIGLSDRTTGYWPHELQLIYIDLMPSFWTQAEMFNTCKRLRASAIKAGQKKDN